jgi:predicted nucleic acid-binding protein
MILLDTGPLVALCDPRDRLNRTALDDLKTLAAAEFAVCEAVLSEACFHLSAPSQRSRLDQLLDRLDVVPAAVDDSQALWREVFAWLGRYGEHEPDWADGCLAVLSGRNRRYKVWTYDAEFRTIWRRPNGSPIPIAV